MKKMKNKFYFILRGALLWAFISANSALKAEECGPYTGLCEGEPSATRKAELEEACSQFEDKSDCIFMGHKINVPPSVIKVCEAADEPLDCVGNYSPCAALYETAEEAQKREAENPLIPPSPLALEWAESNIQGLEHLNESQKESVYRAVEAFYPRLIKWREYSPFYDRLYRSPDWRGKNPFIC